MKFTKIAVATLSLSLLIPNQSNAGIPTIDVTNIVQSTISAIENIEQVIQAYEQIDNQINQIEKQVEQFENLNGDYLKHALLNSTSYKKARRWIPNTYEDVVDLYKTADAEYSDVIDAGWNARDALNIPEATDIYEDIDTTEAIRHQQNESNAMATVGASEMSFKRVEEILQETEDLMEDMENTVDSKAAQDLANRLSAQTQFLLAEVIRIQSTQTASDGRQQLYQHAQKTEDKKLGRFDELPNINDL